MDDNIELRLFLSKIMFLYFLIFIFLKAVLMLEKNHKKPT